MVFDSLLFDLVIFDSVVFILVDFDSEFLYLVAFVVVVSFFIVEDLVGGVVVGLGFFPTSFSLTII
jgi:hypothetical protein